MSAKKDKYSAIITEIADDIFANPQKKAADVVANYCGKLRKSKRTVEGLLKKAKEYNEERIEKQEKVRDEVLAEETKESVKRDILTRNEALEILTNIARGSAKKVKIEENKSEVIIHSATEQVRAIDRIAQMEGWDERKKSEMEVTVVWNENKSYDTEQETNHSS